jgi:prevent-host-death family protein
MRPLEVTRDLFPIATFKARASEVVRRVKRENRPAVITVDGEPAAVLISPQEYDRMAYEDRVREAITQGLEDERAGRVLSTDEIRRRADERFGTLKKSRK